LQTSVAGLADAKRIKTQLDYRKELLLKYFSIGSSATSSNARAQPTQQWRASYCHAGPNLKEWLRGATVRRTRSLVPAGQSAFPLNDDPKDSITPNGARNHDWWRSGVIYQIYPRSFRDANADGIGDLRGIAENLDYCAGLGVDALWLSPIFPSPMVDFGYDVADYTDIAPIFGTLTDFDALLAQTTQRGLKVILDYVPNHTSDQHPWFTASRSSRTDPKRDWYLWHDPAADGGPPNNWLSNFGGSAWEWDAATQQYYYHSFLKEQPDLNWRNPQVVAAMHEVLRFWLRKGVAGFRIDVLWMLIKDDQWRDNPPNPAYRTGMPLFQSQLPLYTTDRPETQDIVGGLRAVVDEFDNRVLIGEIYLPLERLVAYYGRDLRGVQLPFNFQLLQTAWNARIIADLIDRYEAALPAGGWPNWVLGNHDNPRIASRVGATQARVAGMILLTLRGTPTLYYGDEIGMHNVPIPADRIQDPLQKNVPGLGRDPSRTPMQWDASPHAGFGEHRPWLPIAADATAVNVAVEAGDPASILSLYLRLLQLRKQHAALSIGSYQAVAATGSLLAYVRQRHAERLLIIANLGAPPAEFAFQSVGRARSVLLSTYLDGETRLAGSHLFLRPDEGVIIALEPLATHSP
jgi:alpha-glucosidase